MSERFEISTGHERSEPGRLLCIQHFDIQPDIIAMAKGISSGCVPLGAVGCTDEVMEPVEVFQHLLTYGNHPVSCVAALKNIEIMQRENLIQNAHAMGIYLLEGLRTLESHPTVDEARGTGLWTAIDSIANTKIRLLFH